MNGTFPSNNVPNEVLREYKKSSNAYMEWLFCKPMRTSMATSAETYIHFFYSFFTSPYLPFISEVERTSIALNADDVR